MQNFKAFVAWKKQLNMQTYWLGIHLTLPYEIEFKAGQFVFVGVGDREERSYSICSNPIDKEQIEICVNSKPGGLGSRFVSALRVDDDFNFRGPYGDFVVKNNDRPLIFVATGSGIAPVRAMLLDLNFRNDKRPRQLFFGLRSERDLFWQDELERLSSLDPDFEYSVWLSQPSPAWLGKCGRVTVGIQALKKIKRDEFYLCGNTEMVESTKMLLLGQGVDEKSIFYEKMR